MGRDCDPCNGGNNRRNQGFNPENPRDLARELDRGNAGTVMEALQRDAYAMPQRQFENTVRQLAAIENPRYGDNLAVSPRGDIVISREDGRRFSIGNIYRQEDMADSYARRHDGDYRREIPRHPVVQPGYGDDPYYRRDDGRYRPDIATPPYFPDNQRYGRDGRVYQPGFDPRYDRGGYDNRQVGGQVLEDFARGAASGAIGRGDPLKSGLANAAIGFFLNGRRY